MRWVRQTWRRICAGCLCYIEPGEYAFDLGGIVACQESSCAEVAIYNATQPLTKLPSI